MLCIVMNYCQKVHCRRINTIMILDQYSGQLIYAVFPYFSPDLTFCFAYIKVYIVDNFVHKNNFHIL